MRYRNSTTLTVVLLSLGFAAFASADTIYVCWDGSGDYENIQDAIDAADPADEIVVCQGTYYEHIDFLDKSITVRSSHGPHLTIIDGEYLGGSVVRCVGGQGAETKLIGFTITGGNADGPSYPEEFGGGMRNIGSSPTVIDCNFTDNTAVAGGGAMFNEDSDATVIACRFTENHGLPSGSGGGMLNVNSSPTVVNCVFAGNDGHDAGGICNQWGSPTVINCTFSGNSAGSDGGAMRNFDYSSPTVVNCIFTVNTANRNGGAMINETGSNPIVANCTFIANIAVTSGGGIFNWHDSSPEVTNCILWENSDAGGTHESAQIHTQSGSPVVTYSCIQGCTTFCSDPDDHNIGDDPMLTSDGHLLRASPCIDAGDTRPIVELDVFVDADGKGRVMDDRATPDSGVPDGLVKVTVDMGAYEFPAPVQLPGDLDNDCDVDLADLAELLAHYGETCP